MACDELFETSPEGGISRRCVELVLPGGDVSIGRRPRLSAALGERVEHLAARHRVVELAGDAEHIRLEVGVQQRSKTRPVVEPELLRIPCQDRSHRAAQHAGIVDGAIELHAPGGEVATPLGTQLGGVAQARQHRLGVGSVSELARETQFVAIAKLGVRERRDSAEIALVELVASGREKGAYRRPASVCVADGAVEHQLPGVELALQRVKSTGHALCVLEHDAPRGLGTAEHRVEAELFGLGPGQQVHQLRCCSPAEVLRWSGSEFEQAALDVGHVARRSGARLAQQVVVDAVGRAARDAFEHAVERLETDAAGQVRKDRRAVVAAQQHP